MILSMIDGQVMLCCNRRIFILMSCVTCHSIPCRCQKLRGIMLEDEFDAALISFKVNSSNTKIVSCRHRFCLERYDVVRICYERSCESYRSC